MSEEFRQYYVGKTIDILTEETVDIDGVTYTTGYTKEYVRAAFEGVYPQGSIIFGHATRLLENGTLIAEV